jgi:hypothetical protein
VIVVGNEKMKITALTPTSMTVIRGYWGTVATSHAFGTPIRGPVMLEFSYGREGTMLTSTGRDADCSASPPAVSLETLSFGCSSTGPELGAVGDGILGFVELWGPQLLPGTPPVTVAITPLISDLSGDSLTSQGLPSQQIKVVKCGDSTGNGVITNADAVLIQQAVFGMTTPVVATMDINLNGSVTNGDATLVRQVLFLVYPLESAKRCLPSPP